MKNQNRELYTELSVTGEMINYLFICKTKLWLFSHHMNMESEYESVKLGKIIHETTYKEKKKELIIDEHIAIDYITKGDILEIHDIKTSKRMEFAHKAQILYYLYYLKQRGVDNAIGIIDYPLLRKKEEVRLTDDELITIETVIENVKSVINSRMPHPIKTRICKKCAYEEFCWSD